VRDARTAEGFWARDTVIAFWGAAAAIVAWRFPDLIPAIRIGLSVVTALAPGKSAFHPGSADAGSGSSRIGHQPAGVHRCRPSGQRETPPTMQPNDADQCIILPGPWSFASRLERSTRSCQAVDHHEHLPGNVVGARCGTTGG
jgi:hypothetical protein